MNIHFDTTNKDYFVLKIGEREYESASKDRKSQLILPFLLEKLNENNYSLADITSITLNTGPGSFTGVRVGASIAQILAWSLDVPLNGEDFKKDKHIKLVYSPTSFD